MTQPPRRLRPDNSERVSVVVNRVASGSAAGSTRYARPVPGGIASALRSLPPVKAGGPVRVAEMSMAVPDTGEGVTSQVIDYADGQYFEQTASGSVRNSSGSAPGYLAVRLREISPGYQVAYCQLVVFNDANYHYLANTTPQAVDAYQLYFGDPTAWSGAFLGTSIIDYPDQPGYAVQFVDEGVYHFRVTLGIERA